MYTCLSVVQIYKVLRGTKQTVRNIIFSQCLKQKENRVMLRLFPNPFNFLKNRYGDNWVTINSTAMGKGQNLTAL